MNNTGTILAARLDGDFLSIQHGREYIARPKDDLTDLIQRATLALHDVSASAEERVRRTQDLLRKYRRAEAPAEPASQVQAAAPSRGGLAAWRVRRLTAHVDQGLGEAITIADMAAVVGLSPHHFCRAFRASLRETPHNFVMRMRVEKSQELMLTTGLPLGQIAADCGFADQAHFNRAFRKRIGNSPGAWRRLKVDASTTVETAVVIGVGRMTRLKAAHL